MHRDKIVLKAQSMEKVWQKWHMSAADGGHPGVHAMETGIMQAYYYYGDLHAWLAARKLQCPQQSPPLPSHLSTHTTRW
jgi:hypothetical protein